MIDNGTDKRITISNIIDYRFVGVVFYTYIIMEGEGRIVFIDQHAMHERINYERIKSCYTTGNLNTEEFLMPIKMEVPSDITDIIIENIKVFRDMGFDIEHFGDNGFIVRSSPNFIEYGQTEDVVISIADIINNNKKNFDLSIFKDDMIKQMSCKSSIRAGENITYDEVKYLLEKLAKCEIAYTCPHGRPIFFEMTKSFIEKQFKRLGF